MKRLLKLTSLLAVCLTILLSSSITIFAEEFPNDKEIDGIIEEAATETDKEFKEKSNFGLNKPGYTGTDGITSDESFILMGIER